MDKLEIMWDLLPGDCLEFFTISCESCIAQEDINERGYGIKILPPASCELSIHTDTGLQKESFSPSDVTEEHFTFSKICIPDALGHYKCSLLIPFIISEKSGEHRNTHSSSCKFIVNFNIDFAVKRNSAVIASSSKISCEVNGKEALLVTVDVNELNEFPSHDLCYEGTNINEYFLQLTLRNVFPVPLTIFPAPNRDNIPLGFKLVGCESSERFILEPEEECNVVISVYQGRFSNTHGDIDSSSSFEFCYQRASDENKALFKKHVSYCKNHSSIHTVAKRAVDFTGSVMLGPRIEISDEIVNLSFCVTARFQISPNIIISAKDIELFVYHFPTVCWLPVGRSFLRVSPDPSALFEKDEHNFITIPFTFKSKFVFLHSREIRQPEISVIS
jgi:hypothetical protein